MLLFVNMQSHLTTAPHVSIFSIPRGFSQSKMPPAKPKKNYPVIAPFEVIVHNKPEDCWLSFLGKVFDVTPIIKKHKDENCVKPVIAFAGKDVSHWFDERTGEIQHFVHPISGIEVPFCPHGRIPDVLYEVPTTAWRPLDGPPWWKNEAHQVGVLTKKVRPLRIIDMLLGKEALLRVCWEDDFYRIRERYSIFNSEADSYTWVYMSEKVDMAKTMEENGIPDDRDAMAELGIPRNFYTPSVRLYYNDDLRHFDDLSDDEKEDEDRKIICCDQVVRTINYM